MKDFFRSLKTRFSTLGSLFRFLAEYRMWWMIPMVLMLVLFMTIVILGHSTPLGPFIYAIF